MSTQPAVEDITAIVSRFQAWAGKQKPASTKTGVREVSYEEAKRSSRRDAPAEVSDTNRKPAGKDHQDKRGTAMVAAAPIEKPDFRQTLEKQIAIVPTIQRSSSLTVERRSSMLSIRVTDAERSLFKSRAAEANLSVSAYMRQCVLQVEELRTQVERHLLAASGQNCEPESQSEGVFDSIAQFMRRLFRGSAPTPSVRA
ncbi:MAG TPA: hypothetical protein VHT24_17305 [Pseudacidobacterium sp.]|jgi:hypothetical protein|nr:hypothetical protein [Pseudacidobacterium sp.]